MLTETQPAAGAAASASALKVNSHNEWDPLREIIVGTATGAIASLTFPDARPIDPHTMEEATALAREAYPQWLVDEAAEDLEDVCAALRRAGVRVLRPGGYDPAKLFATPDWQSTGNNLYNMRDLHLVVGNTVVTSSSPRRHRLFEATGLYDIWYEYLKQGFRWVVAPPPRLTGDYATPYHVDGQRFIRLAETEILFDAANTLRMGRDLLYLVSSAGNHLAAKWLQSVLGDEVRVHTTEGIYRSSHIDSTVLVLRPGLVLLCADRVNPQNCPAMFDKWDKIYFEEIAPYPQEVVEFQTNVRSRIAKQLAAMGVYSDIGSMSSPWVGMNVLSIDPDTVVVDARQTALIREFEKHGLTTVPVRMRHSFTMKGGLHCCTLDTVRDSRFESYFD